MPSPLARTAANERKRCQMRTPSQKLWRAPRSRRRARARLACTQGRDVRPTRQRRPRYGNEGADKTKSASKKLVGHRARLRGDSLQCRWRSPRSRKSGPARRNRNYVGQSESGIGPSDGMLFAVAAALAPNALLMPTPARHAGPTLMRGRAAATPTMSAYGQQSCRQPEEGGLRAGEIGAPYPGPPLLVGDRDACGVGFLADQKGRRRHDIMARALVALGCMEHRGGFSHQR